MRLIDVHAHLESKRFEGDLDEVVQRARDAGVEVIINSGVNPTTNRQSLELAEKYDIVKVSFGIFPIDAIAGKIDDFGEESDLRHVEKFDLGEELVWIEENKDKCVAIGEVGLDYKIVPGTEDLQKEAFGKIVALAKKIDKTLLIHSRKGEEDVIEILEEAGFARKISAEVDSHQLASRTPISGCATTLLDRGGASRESGGKTCSAGSDFGTHPPTHDGRTGVRQSSKSKDNDVPGVVMHCFNGRKSLIKRAVENGWYFSVPPVITRLDHFKMLVEMVPLEQLLTETDSPYLSPVAGERNESANVAVTIKEIAKIKGVEEEEVAEQIWKNAGELGFV